MPHVLETPSELPFTWTVTPQSGHLSTHHLPDLWYLFSSPTSEPVGVRAQGGAGVRQTGVGVRVEAGAWAKEHMDLCPHLGPARMLPQCWSPRGRHTAAPGPARREPGPIRGSRLWGLENQRWI